MILGYKVPFSEVARQSKYPRQVPMSRKESLLVEVQKSRHSRKRGNQNDRFKLEKIFELHLLVEKKESSQRPVINLESLKFLRTFQNGGIISFKRALERRGFSMQVRLEKCTLPCSIARRIRILYVSSRKTSSMNFFCLCFGLAPAPLVFTKLIKIPIAVIKRLNGRIIIYRHGILITAGSMEVVVMSATWRTFMKFTKNLYRVQGISKKSLPCDLFNLFLTQY